MKKWCVYKHITPSQKVYIGITSQEPQKRWLCGYGYTHNKYFDRAIKKYGWNNIAHIIIARGLTEDEAKWLEIELIKAYDSTNNENGYNLTLGGEGGNGYIPSEETRIKMSEKMKGENNPFFGKHHSEETKKKISNSNSGENSPFFGRHLTKEHKEKIGKSNKGKKRTKEQCNDISKRMKGRFAGEKHPNYGKKMNDKQRKKMSDSKKGTHQSEETRNKISKSLKGKNKGKRSGTVKIVFCITTGKSFWGRREAGEYYNIKSDRGISSCCNKQKEFHGTLENGEKLRWMFIKGKILLNFSHNKKYKIKDLNK